MKIRLFTLSHLRQLYLFHNLILSVFLQVYEVCSHKSIYTKKLIEVTIPAYVLNATASLFSLVHCMHVDLWAILAQILADLFLA